MTASTTSAEGAAELPDNLSDADIRQYLKEHPDFFDRHPDLLDQLHISHSTGSAVSLVEKQVSVLRERNMEMRKRLNSLTSNARDNDRLHDLTRKLILNLLEAGGLDSLAKTFTRSLRDDFEVEYVSIILFGNPELAGDHSRVEAAESARIEIGALLKSRAPVCGTLREEELGYLFPGASGLGSAAVVPLLGNANASQLELGVIAVGSTDPNYYSASMGTVFLSHIADVMVRLLPRVSQSLAAPSDP
ncbi:MAG: DUF484 family protein [Pseudomonadota bacterium]